MSSELRIRPGSAADADSVAAVHLRGWETYRGLVPDRLIDTRTLARRRAEWRQELERSSDGLFVAEAGTVVGFIRAERPRLEADRIHDSEITYLYVDAPMRGRGLGRMLLAAGAAWMNDQGWRTAIVTAFDGNPFAAFYQAMGGRLVARRPFVMDGWHGMDAVYAWDDLRIIGGS